MKTVENGAGLIKKNLCLYNSLMYKCSREGLILLKNAFFRYRARMTHENDIGCLLYRKCNSLSAKKSLTQHRCAA